MRKDKRNCTYTVRLNPTLPEHVKIRNYLDDLDVRLFKSKNSFILDAINYYIDAVEDGSAFEKNEPDYNPDMEKTILEKTQKYVDQRLLSMVLSLIKNEGVVNNLVDDYKQDRSADEDFEYDDELAKVTSMFTD